VEISNLEKMRIEERNCEGWIRHLFKGRGRLTFGDERLARWNGFVIVNGWLWINIWRTGKI